jgi:hypothetical protein
MLAGDRNVIKKEAEKIIKCRLYNKNTAHMDCKNKSDINNNRGNWNHLKIIQKIPDPHTGTARNQGTTQNSHIGHRTRTAESANVKVQNV